MYDFINIKGRNSKWVSQSLYQTNILSAHVLMMMKVTSKENSERTQVVKVRKMGERASAFFVACEAALPYPVLHAFSSMLDAFFN